MMPVDYQSILNEPLQALFPNDVEAKHDKLYLMACNWSLVIAKSFGLRNVIKIDVLGL